MILFFTKYAPAAMIAMLPRVIPMYIIADPVLIEITTLAEALLLSSVVSSMPSMLLTLLNAALFVKVPVVFSVVALVSTSSTSLVLPGSIATPAKLVVYNLPLLAISEYSNYSYVATFDVAKYKRAYMASINTRFQKFNNSDIVDRFLSHIDYLLDMFESCDPTHTWHFYGTMKPLTEAEVRNDCKGLCAIKATTYPATKDTVFAAPPPEPEAKNYLHNINKVMYEYMTGYPFDVLEEDTLKYNLDVELGNTERDVSEAKDFSDAEIEEMIQSRIDSQTMDEFLTEESLTATMYYVAQERDLGRKIAHTVRSGAEAVAKGADRAKRAVQSVVGPVMDKTKALIDSIQKSNREDTREEIITDSDFVKLRNFFKMTALPTAIMYYALGPALAIVGFLVMRAKRDDNKRTRDAIVRELETELKLTREKIEDARRKDDDKAKYELMRLESKLEDEIANIKYGRG